MASLSTRYVCQQCSSESLKWAGKCPNCGEWNSLVEVTVSKKDKQQARQLVTAGEQIRLNEVAVNKEDRQSTGFEELDRVLGGGIVQGSVILIGGEPGIGKSTLLLQVALKIGGLYVSAEESAYQVKLRAERLSGNPDEVWLLPTSNVDKAIASILQSPPKLVVIDSIQTIATDDLDGVPGSIGQVRECAHRLVKVAKDNGVPIIIVSHVTKEGVIAGPKALEHVVDTVVYVEGEEQVTTRLVRSVKNRFGPVHEVGLFELTEQGMLEIANPNDLLSETSGQSSGSVVTVSMEGARPILLEIQALTSKTSFGLPRRTANGMDYNRLLLLIAVLAKRAKVQLHDQDVYTAIAGGLRMTETALDLPICLALASSLYNKALPSHTVAFGEVALSGELKPVIGQQKRIEQAKRLGYKHVICPGEFKTLQQALQRVFSVKE